MEYFFLSKENKGKVQIKRERGERAEETKIRLERERARAGGRERLGERRPKWVIRTRCAKAAPCAHMSHGT
jgi:hypothetical protein